MSSAHVLGRRRLAAANQRNRRNQPPIKVRDAATGTSEQKRMLQRNKPANRRGGLQVCQVGGASSFKRVVRGGGAPTLFAAFVAAFVFAAAAAAAQSDGGEFVGRHNQAARPADFLAAMLQAAPLSTSTSTGAGERPRLIPLVAAESGYSENSSVNILCTVSEGHHETLRFEWFKDGRPIARPAPSDQATGGGELGDDSAPLLSSGAGGQPPKIEQQPDHSLLRIARVRPQHAGRYTCAAKSQFGQDSSSVNLNVNVKLQWLKEPPRELAVSLNQELKVDCLAQGEPRPTMRWQKVAAAELTLAGDAAKQRGQHAAVHHTHYQHAQGAAKQQQQSQSASSKYISHS